MYRSLPAIPAAPETARGAWRYPAHAAPSPAAARRAAAWPPSSAPIAHTSIHLSPRAHSWCASLRLSSHHVRTDRLKPALKCLRRHPREGRVAAQCHRILEVLVGQPNHVLACNLVRLRRDIHHPHFRPAAHGIYHLLERNRRKPSILNRHHGRSDSIEQELRRTISEIAGVFHIERNRVRTA